MKKTTNPESLPSIHLTDRNFIVIKQIHPRPAEIGFPISSADLIISAIRQAVLDAQKVHVEPRK
jgi:hypothetical protein